MVIENVERRGGKCFIATYGSVLWATSELLTFWFFFFFSPPPPKKKKAGLEGPGWHRMARSEAQRQRLPPPPRPPLPLPTSPFCHRSPSLPPSARPRPVHYLSLTPPSLPLPPPRPTCLHNQEVAVEVHGGSQSLAPPPAQELSDEFAASFEVVPPTAPLPGLPVFCRSGPPARQLSLRPALHALASMCLRQTRGGGVQEGSLLEASPGEAGPGAALQGAVTTQEPERVPALKRAHVD